MAAPKCFRLPLLAAAVVAAVALMPVNAGAQEARELSVDKVLMRARGDRRMVVEFSSQAGKLVIQTAGKPVAVADSAAAGVPELFHSVPLSATLKLEAATGAVVPEELKLRASEKWAGLPKATRDRFDVITRANEALEAASARALSPQATAEDLLDFRHKVAITESAVVDAFVGLPRAQQANATVLVDQYALIRKTSKAIYGRDDRYPPLAYERIYRNSKGVVALQRVGEQDPFCSGVLIGRNLVLTNYHCIVGELVSELKISIHYETDLNNDPVPGKRSFPVAKFLVRGSNDPEKLDFALLEISEDAATGQFPGDVGVGEPQCLSTHRVRHDEPLYLIGHPDGRPRTVHDNAFAIFPFVVTAEERGRIDLSVQAELKGAADRDAQYQSFVASYRPKTLASGEQIYEHYSVSYGRRPTIGADSDTFHGNSGSPAFSRRSHRVVGLLFAGENDVDEPWKPGWRSHEAILPITEVIAFLDTQLPEWSTFPGVCKLDIGTEIAVAETGEPLVVGVAPNGDF